MRHNTCHFYGSTKKEKSAKNVGKSYHKNISAASTRTCKKFYTCKHMCIFQLTKVKNCKTKIKSVDISSTLLFSLPKIATCTCTYTCKQTYLLVFAKYAITYRLCLYSHASKAFIYPCSHV